MVKPFTVICNECKSEDITYICDYDRVVSLICNKCDNVANEYELEKGETK